MTKSLRKKTKQTLCFYCMVTAAITLSIKAIARRLHLGTSKSANIRLQDGMKDSAASAPVPSPAKERL